MPVKKAKKKKYSSPWSQFVRQEVWGEDERPQFSNGLAAKERRGKWGYINRQGKTVIPARYDWADRFYGKTAVVRQGWNNEALYALIDKSGKLLTTFKYKTIEGARRNTRGTDSIPSPNKQDKAKNC